MARTSPLHWVGVVFLLIAAILVLITTISAPVVGDLAILKVMLTNKTDIRHSSVTFGTFGHCVLDVPPIQTDQDYCFPKHVGYEPADIMAAVDGTHFSKATANTVHELTRAMVLHPIACALAFIAFALSCGTGVVGSLLGAATAALAWVLTLIVMAIDFTLFGVIKNHVNSHHISHAYYSTGMWTCLTAMILLFLGMFIVLFTCFSARKAAKKANLNSDRFMTSRDGPIYDSLYGNRDGFATTTTPQTKQKRFGIF